MYARNVEGRELTFGVSGKLIMNALVMYDRQTDSLWSQFLGSSVAGEFEGTALALVPSSLVTWEAWKTLHPDTKVLDQKGRRSDPYDSYYRDGSAGVLGEEQRDDRLRRKEFVLGVQLDVGMKAFPFRHLNLEPVLNDSVENIPVLITFDPDAGGATAFDPTVADRTLTFEPIDTAEGQRPVMTDAETGSLWDSRTGEAFEGELAGTVLETLPSFAVFWFAWSDFFPNAPLYEPA